MQKLRTPVIMMKTKPDAAPGTPSSGGYACGWGSLTPSFAKQPLVFHGGSNTLNLAHIWIDAENDLSTVLVTNISGTKAHDALMKLAPELYKIGIEAK